MSIRVLLSDNYRIVREGIRSLLKKEPDIEVVGEAEDGRSTVQLARKVKPHVVVMNITTPGLNGVDATSQITKQMPSVKVLAFSIHIDWRFVSAMLKAGATGYLTKDCAYKELVDAIHTVAANQTYLSSRIADIIRREYVQKESKADNSVFSLLTPRERETLQLMAEGKSTKDIALHLELSMKTIETYRQHIMAKLNLHSVAKLTKYAIREGLTSLES